MGLVEELEKSLSGIKEGKALDIGTRFGEFAIRLADVMPEGSDIIGIDSLPDVIDKARAKCSNKSIIFECMDATSLEYPSDTFEVVALSNTMHHIEKYETVLDEMYRVLKPGGFFILNEMYSDVDVPAQMTHVIQHTFEAKLDMLKGIYQKKTWTRSEIIDIAKRIPLKDVTISDYIEDEEFDKKLKIKNDELLDRTMKDTENLSDDKRDQLIKEAKEIQEMCQKNGIQRCVELLYIGRK